MSPVLSAPIGILDEHPEWSRRLVAELESRRLPWEKIDHSNHAYDPADDRPQYAVIVNRTSPSSHRRGHASVLFYAEALLTHYESRGVPVINPVRAYRFEKSKALQVDLFERLGVPYPPTIVVNHRDQVLKALDRLSFPLLVKPNVGGVRGGDRPLRRASGPGGGPRPARLRPRRGPRSSRSSWNPKMGPSCGWRCWTGATSTRSAWCARGRPTTTSAPPTSAPCRRPPTSAHPPWTPSTGPACK